MAAPVDTLMNNDTDAETGVRVADDTAGNDIVHHYKRYYHLLIKYRRDTLTTADSAEVATLANMCPYVDGTVVYKARGLYNRIYPIRTFSDLGCEDSDPETPESRKSNTSGSDVATEQGYMLYPNPSDGNIMLQQKVPDNNPVRAEVYNATGASVYKGVFQFSGGLTSFTMHNKIPGVYVLHLTDSNANEFILKFTIE